MPLRGNFHQLQELKRLYPRIKVLISIEGNAMRSSKPRNPKIAMLSSPPAFNNSFKAGFADGVEAPSLFDASMLMGISNGGRQTQFPCAVS